MRALNRIPAKRPISHFSTPNEKHLSPGSHNTFREKHEWTPTALLRLTSIVLTPHPILGVIS